MCAVLRPCFVGRPLSTGSDITLLCIIFFPCPEKRCGYEQHSYYYTAGYVLAFILFQMKDSLSIPRMF
jgi:hypothetical protein